MKPTKEIVLLKTNQITKQTSNRGGGVGGGKKTSNRIVNSKDNQKSDNT